MSTKVRIFGVPAAATLLCLAVWLMTGILAIALCTAPIGLADISPRPGASPRAEGRQLPPHLRPPGTPPRQ